MEIDDQNVGFFVCQRDQKLSTGADDVDIVSALATGLGFLFAFIVLGTLREIFGHGTLLSGIEMIAGETSRDLTVTLPVDGMLVASLPPGAFFAMGLLLALRNRLAQKPAHAGAPEAPR